jgi:cell division protein ZapA
MKPEDPATSVHILGHEYRIRSTEEPAFVREVALYVDEVMHRISSRMTAGTKSQIAVLAALNIAEELFRERRNGTGMDPEELEQRLRALLQRLDEAVPHTPGSRASTAR